MKFCTQRVRWNTRCHEHPRLRQQNNAGRAMRTAVIVQCTLQRDQLSIHRVGV